MVFTYQLEAVDKAIPFALYREGNNSAMIDHTIGPHAIFVSIHGADRGSDRLTDSISEDKEASKTNHSNGRVRCLVWCIAIESVVADGCKDQEAYNHPSATSHQRLTTTIVLNDIETEEGATKVDAVENHLSDK